jgi:hypothetical protein
VGGCLALVLINNLAIDVEQRRGSGLTALSDDRWAELTADERLRRIEEPSELFGALTSGSARIEIWQGLLLVFLLILIGEVVMTRRLVQGGHHEVLSTADDSK